jgi:hypothetical protein
MRSAQFMVTIFYYSHFEGLKQKLNQTSPESTELLTSLRFLSASGGKLEYLSFLLIIRFLKNHHLYF